jgi:Holliday junction resolvasome RuvABC endonuclease subunit
MNFLSIDLGIKNLGFAIYYQIGSEATAFDFGLYNINDDIKDHTNSKTNVIPERCKAVKRFFESLKFDNYEAIIIERQVVSNSIACYLMYSIAMEALNYTNNVVIFTPSEKFKTFQIPYSTTNKQHKRLSITLTSNLITKHFPEMIHKFNTFEKKDDIADAINQLITVLYQRKIKLWRLELNE